MDFTEEDVNNFDVLKEKFRSHCEPRKNLTYLRHLFFTRAQAPNELIDAYVTDLKNKAKECEFAQLTESLIRDRIVCGVSNDQIRARLLREPDLDLKKAIDICRASEITKKQIKALHEETEATVNKISKMKFTKISPEKSATSSTVSKKEKCTRCGYSHEPRKCPAFGQICKVCRRKNHFGRMCKTQKQIDKSKYSTKKVHEIGQEDFTELFIGAIEEEQAKNKVKMQINEVNDATAVNKDKWTETLKINKSSISFKLDTGAECNVISYKDFQAVAGNSVSLCKSNCVLVAYSGHKMEPKGKAKLICQFKDNEAEIEFQVLEKDSPAILGRLACTELGLVKRIYKVDCDENTHILKEFDDVFNGLGCIPGSHHIKIDPAVVPVIHPPRRVPIALKDRIKTELNRMESLGVIEKQTEPTDWVNSLVTVVKPNKLRICIDPKDLNRAIKREHFPLKTVEEVVSEMPNANIFSVLDANHGFWQIQLDEESSKLCTFNTPFGRYRFKRLPFGVSSAPEVFQKCIAQRLEDLEGVVNIMDDILVWGENVEQHDARLRRLLERVRSINLKLNREKCKIRMDEIKYIGHVLSGEGLKPDPDKIKAIVEMYEPQDKSALMRFLGVVQYLAKFIPNLSENSAPLRKLLESGVEWHWEF
ncbi:uncharacterized protein K02A2.6-like isoform X1 [Triplophysa rosa]|uniref:uncharacterized protein K02A2.6-like isoform X1 n=1 Tax=Triplophysa rosa TaxID=992332 RepID=UPI002545C37A|nr:uncharacterized protein K02A2.6-like isoform X1 [Triplophysa rosa]XP_057191717.1 uncharacterized protein K02A2.6-like isoform X1 [Triplophysa rosa]